MGLVSYRIDRFLAVSAGLYGRLLGGPFQRIAGGQASLADKLLYTAAIMLMAGVLLSFAAVVEFLLQSYMRVFALVWVVAVFFFLAAIDLRARKLLSK